MEGDARTDCLSWDRGCSWQRMLCGRYGLSNDLYEPSLCTGDRFCWPETDGGKRRVSLRKKEDDPV